jgi:hypothetical protein
MLNLSFCFGMICLFISSRLFAGSKATKLHACHLLKYHASLIFGNVLTCVLCYSCSDTILKDIPEAASLKFCTRVISKRRLIFCSHVFEKSQNWKESTKIEPTYNCHESTSFMFSCY